NVLAELAQAPDPRAAVDLMASLRIPLARPLVRARAGHPSAEIPELELALDRWYFEGAFAELGAGLPGAACLKDALALEADLTNLLTVLRLAYTHRTRPFCSSDSMPGTCATCGWVRGACLSMCCRLCRAR